MLKTIENRVQTGWILLRGRGDSLRKDLKGFVVSNVLEQRFSGLVLKLCGSLRPTLRCSALKKQGILSHKNVENRGGVFNLNVSSPYFSLIWGIHT